jgi:hypothetical protein
MAVAGGATLFTSTLGPSKPGTFELIATATTANDLSVIVEPPGRIMC